MNTHYTNTFRTLGVGLALTAGLTAAAQLNKEIRVERDIEPTERTARRLDNIAPGLVTPKVQHTALTAGEYNGQGELSRHMDRLEPAAWRDTIETTPYRGYVAGGYFPTFNAGIVAGYRFVNRRNTTLDGRLQYNGYNYKGLKDFSLERNTFGVGLDLQGDYRFGTLKADANAQLGNWTMPWFEESFSQSAHDVSIGAEILSPAHRTLPWHGALRVENFGYGKDTPTDPATYTFKYPKATETVFSVAGGVGFRVKGHTAALDVEGKFQHINTLTNYHVVNYVFSGGATQGIISLRPGYTYKDKDVSLRLGVRADIATGGVTTGVTVAPDVSLAWTPGGQFSAYAKATGGKRLNTLASLHAWTPYQATFVGYGRSNVPVDIELGVNLGAFRGFRASVFGGYSKAKDWLLPFAASLETETPMFKAMDIDAVRYGIALSYNYNGIVEVKAKGMGASHGENHGYYEWRDGARWVVDADVTVKPIKPLDVTLGYTLRAQRRYLRYNVFIGGATPPALDDYSLGNESDLHLQARYRITEPLSVFLNLENILCHRHLLMPGIQSKSIHGLLGVSYKF